MKTTKTSNPCWNERQVLDYIHKRIKNSQQEAVITNGDDCYAFQPDARQVQLITTDAMLEHVHWHPKWCSIDSLAEKLVAINVSDIAAMGGIPERAFLTLGIPPKTELNVIYKFIDRLVKALKIHRIDLCGGDTTASARDFFLSLTMQGHSLTPTPISRSGAQPKDLILVTGDLGGAVAGREVLAKPLFSSDWRTAVIERFINPCPRLEEGRVLAESKKVHAMIDCSDGLAGDIRALTRESKVGAVLYEANFPIALMTRLAAKRFKQDVISWALGGGEDYELIFTCSPQSAGYLMGLLQEKKLAHCSIIGEILPKSKGLSLVTAEGYQRKLPDGFEHVG